MSGRGRYGIILFDGVCNLCNHAVDFVIRRDRRDRFKFASLQEPFLKDFLDKHRLASENPDSVVFIYRDKVYFKSRAALEIAKLMGGYWSLLYIFLIVPPLIRDPIYNWVARNRYSWFGRRSSCRVPDAVELSKFLKAADF